MNYFCLVNKYFFLVVCCAFATQVWAADDSRSDTLDVSQYSIHLTITDFAGQSISGFCDIDYRSKVAGLSLSHFDLLSLTVDSVRYNGVGAVFTQVGELVGVSHASMSVGDSSRIRIYYRGTPSSDASGFGGFSFSGLYAYNIGVGFDATPHNFGRVWFPCIDNFIDRSRLELYITTGSLNKAICNGALVGSSVNVDGTITWHWSQTIAIPTYLATVSVAPYVNVEQQYSGIAGVLPITFSALAADTTNVKSSFVHLPEAIAAYEARFGPYVWQRIGYVIVPFMAGAMEHASCISYPKFAVDGSLNYETMMAHELSHHWWGDLVTCKTAGDMWLNEGFASYCERLFVEQTYGWLRYKRDVRKNHYDVLMNAHINDGGYLSVAGVDHAHTYSSHVYNKGADVVHTLRFQLGDSLFFNCLQGFLVAYQHQNITTEMLREYLTTCSGNSLTPFFAEWIQSPGFVDYCIKRHSNSAAVSLSQTSKASPISSYTPVKQEVTLFDANWQPTTVVVTPAATLANCHSIDLGAYDLADYIHTELDIDEKVSDASTGEYKRIYVNGLNNFVESKLNLNITNIVDSAWLRIQHHFAAPRKSLNLPGRLHLADRYWEVSGIANPAFSASAIFNYDGTATNSFLDQTFISTTEDSLVLLYMAENSNDWEILPYPVNVVGFATNKKGNFNCTDLNFGLYTFGIYDSSLPATVDQYVGANDCVLSALQEQPWLPSWQLLPNPADNSISIEIQEVNSSSITLSNMAGKSLLRLDAANQTKLSINTSTLATGMYMVTLADKQGRLEAKKVMVQH